MRPQPLVIRITHWVNVPVLVVMAMSGLQILHAYPYFGPQGERWTWVPLQGWVTPEWMRAGQWLAGARHLHFLFAWLFVINGLIFTVYAVISRHLTRDLNPTGKDLREIGKAVNDHIRLRHPKGEEAKRYNVLQKLAYLSVIFGLAPLIVLTGLTMSPTIDTAFPWLLTIFGGRQAARTIHFIACFSFVGFIVIHVSQVILTGFFNNIRSMITGWFVIKREGISHEA